MKLGGDIELIDAVIQSGRQPGPAVFWMGSWITNDFSAYVDFLNQCKARGVRPMVHLWYWGDQISPSAILNGTSGYHGEFKSQQGAANLATQCAQRANANNAAPLFVIESEWNKRGIESWNDWSHYYLSIANLLRSNCPGAEIVCSPGNWGNLSALAQFHLSAFRGSDWIGTQSLHCIVRGESITSYQNPQLSMVQAIQTIRNADSALSNIPALITDWAHSSYGGNFSSSPPFGNGSGSALEDDQDVAFRNVVDSLPGIQAICYRSLRDNPSMDTTNYFGYGERYWGVVRADGSIKPGYTSLLAIASLFDRPPPENIPIPEPVQPPIDAPQPPTIDAPPQQDVPINSSPPTTVSPPQDIISKLGITPLIVFGSVVIFGTILLLVGRRPRATTQELFSSSDTDFVSTKR